MSNKCGFNHARATPVLALPLSQDATVTRQHETAQDLAAATPHSGAFSAPLMGVILTHNRSFYLCFRQIARLKLLFREGSHAPEVVRRGA
jgi:hypothetical protein